MRSLKKRIIVAGVAGLVLTGLVSACGSSSSAPNSAGSASKTIRMGAAAAPPFLLHDATGNWTSFAAELARKFAQANNVKIEFVPTTFPTIVAGLQANKYDFIQPINATAQRRAVIDFTSPVSAAGSLYFVKQGATFQTLNDLNKPSVRIATISGSAEEEATRKLLPKATLRSLPTASVADLATEVTAGRSDAMVDSSYLAPALVAKFPLRTIPNYTSNPDGLEPIDIGFAVRKGDSQLLAQLNAFIASEKASGDMKALADKWLTVDNALKG